MDHFMVIPARPAVLQPLSARELWKIHHREERMRRKGYPEHEINPPVIARVGTFSGMRFVTSHAHP